jgi:foldase protein PrsA
MVFRRALASLGLLASVTAFAWAQQPTSTTPPAELKAPPDPDTVAVVNGEKITRADVIRYLLAQYGSSAVDRLVDLKLMEQAAKKQNVTVTQADMDRVYEQYRKTAPTPQVFDDYEKQVGKQFIMMQLEPRVIMVKLGEKISQVSDDELEEIRASHILVRVDSSGPDAAAKDKAAKDKIEKALAEIKEGKDFAEVAKQYSEDPGTAQNGGDLGVFGRGRMVKEFEDAAFAAKVGEVVGPIKTTYGYHLIKVTERHPASEMDPITRGQKHDDAILQKTRSAVNAWLADYRKSAKVDKYKLIPDNFIPK